MAKRVVCSECFHRGEISQWCPLCKGWGVLTRVTARELVISAIAPLVNARAQSETGESDGN